MHFNMTENFWYILIAIVATLTIIVIGIIIFLIRHNNNIKKSDRLMMTHNQNMTHQRSIYSQSQNNSEDLFERQNIT